VPELRYGNLTTSYQVRPSKRLNGRVCIHVHPDGAVEVERPVSGTTTQVRDAVQKRARWIFEALKAVSADRIHVQSKQYVSGETCFYLGRRYRLDVRKGRGEPSVKLVGGMVRLVLPVVDKAAVRRRLRQWYRQKAEDYLGRRLKAVSGRVSWLADEPTLKFLTMKYRWGSCSPKGSININPALIRAPRHCIDYVLIHEICHLREHNHSKRFYELLEKHCPNWVQTKAELDRMAELFLAE
jgi:predicted metal-dependent hydrolase